MLPLHLIPMLRHYHRSPTLRRLPPNSREASTLQQDPKSFSFLSSSLLKDFRKNIFFLP